MAMLRRGLLALPLLALAACGRPGLSADDPAPAEPAGEGRVAAVIDGASVALESGLEVRLAGLLAPLPRRGRASAEPHHQASRAMLSALVLGERVTLATPPGAPPRDRWGRAVARLALPGREGLSVARALAEQGAVRVRPEDEADGEARALLALEAGARAKGLGLWASPYYGVRPAEAVGPGAQGSFQIVEGVVVDAAAAKGWLYLNFGPDYRSDFTAGAPPETSARFDRDEMLGLPAAVVRVRGEIESYNGPFVRLVAPAQIEVLGTGG